MPKQAASWEMLLGVKDSPEVNQTSLNLIINVIYFQINFLNKQKSWRSPLVAPGGWTRRGRPHGPQAARALCFPGSIPAFCFPRWDSIHCDKHPKAKASIRAALSQATSVRIPLAIDSARVF